MHVNAPSATVSRSEDDLSFTECSKNGKTDGSCVVSMMVIMQERALVSTTLFVRPQRVNRVGKYSARRGLNDVPSPEATTLMRSMAAPESLVRSDSSALFNGLEDERMTLRTSSGNSHPPSSQRL